jgi:glutaredoxin 3
MRTIRLYTTPWCPYCHAAKSLLDDLGLSYEETDVERDPELRARLSAENGGYRTVPMIFLGEDFIGGYTDLKALHDRGELTSRVAEDT